MENLSFFEKLGVLFSNIFAHPIFICLLLLPVLFVIFNKKITKKLFVFVYVGVLLIVLFVGNKVIFDLFDNVVDGLFMTLYFPNFITLFIVEVISFVITLVTFFKKVKKVNKVINITSFAVIQTLFCLVLTVIKANNIDIYKENALYSNSDVLTIMQLLMGMFALQVISLVVIYLIDKITLYLDSKSMISPKIQERLDEVKVTRNQREPIITPASEPNVVITPQKPLDRSLIKEKKISSIDLEEEISKDNETAKLSTLEDNLKTDDSFNEKVISFDDFKMEYPSFNVKEEEVSDEKLVNEVKGTSDEKLDLFKVMETDSDDKTLEDNKENEVSDEKLVNEVKGTSDEKPDLFKVMETDSDDKTLEDNNEEDVSDEKLVNEVKGTSDEKLDLFKVMETDSDDKTLEDNNEEEVSDEKLVNEVKGTSDEKPDLFKVMETDSDDKTLKENIVNFDDFKPEYPDVKTKENKVSIPPLKTLDVPIISLKQDDNFKKSSLKNGESDTNDAFIFDNKEEFIDSTSKFSSTLSNNDLSNNKGNTIRTSLENKGKSSLNDDLDEGSTELITNLRIINFEKMVDVILKLKRVYTL